MKKSILMVIMMVGLITSPLLAYRGFGMGGCWGWWPFHGFMGWFFMLIFMLVFLYIIVYFVRKILSPPRTKYTTPLEELKLKYARGEISREEFERKKKEILDLGGE